MPIILFPYMTPSTIEITKSKDILNLKEQSFPNVRSPFVVIAEESTFPCESITAAEKLNDRKKEGTIFINTAFSKSPSRDTTCEIPAHEEKFSSLSQRVASLVKNISFLKR